MQFLQQILLGQQGQFTPIFFILLIWSIYWKGTALWKAAKNNQKYWFCVMLVASTVGILEIVYLSYFQKPLKAEKPSKTLKKK